MYKSDIPGKITEPTFERFGDLCKRFEGDFLFSAFNVPDIISCQIGFFGQSFLAQAKFFPPGAHGLPYDTINFA